MRYETNHYIRILGGEKGKEWFLDTPEHPTASEIEQQIGTKQNAWNSSNSSNDVPKMLVDLYREQLGETKKKLASPQAASSTNEIGEARKDGLTRLEKRLLAMFATPSNPVGKAYLCDSQEKGSDIAVLSSELHYSPDFIRRTAENLRIKIVSTSPVGPEDISQACIPDEPNRPRWVVIQGSTDIRSGVLDKNGWEGCRVRIECIPGMAEKPKTLYSFLEEYLHEGSCSKNTSLSELQTAISEVSSLWHGNKKDKKGKEIPPPATGAIQERCKELCSIAREQFFDAGSKIYYDAMLRLESGGVLEFLWYVLPRWRFKPDKNSKDWVISYELWEEAVSRVRRNTDDDSEAEWIVWYILTQAKGPKCLRLPPDISGLLGQAVKELAAGRYAEAQKTLERAEAKSPNDPKVAQLKAQADEGMRKVREAAAKVAAAEKAIKADLASEDYAEAQKKVDAARNLPGFQPGPWESEIEKGKTKKEYEAAKTAGDWALAERLGKRRAALGDGTEAQWKADIEKEKGNRRANLATRCQDALKAFDAAEAGNRYAPAKEAWEKACGTRGALEKDYPGSREAMEAKAGVEGRARKWATLEENHAVEGLPPAEGVNAQGSDGESPMVTVSWKTGSTGKAVERWRVRRRENGTWREIGKTSGTSWTDRDAKAGMEYRYGVAPMAKAGADWKANDGKEVVSGPTVCLASIVWESLQGLGEPGGNAAVTLKWRISGAIGASVPGLSLELSRSPAFPSGKSMALAGGTRCWTDRDVTVGETYRYSVVLVYDAKPKPRRGPVADSGPVVVKAVEPPPPVEDLVVCRLKDREFSATWTWKGDATKASWRVEPMGASGEVERLGGAETGGLMVYSRGGRSTLFVRAMCAAGEVTRKAVKEASAPFGEPSVVTCVLRKPSRWQMVAEVLGKKPVPRKKAACVLSLHSNAGGFPPMVVRLGRTSEPQHVAEGTELGRPVAVPGRPGEAELEIPHGAKGYLHVFLLPPASSEEWQIMQPDDNEVG